MLRHDVDLDTLFAVLDDPRSVEDLAWYFDPGTPPRCAGSRFEALGGGGDRLEVATTITADDLVAVTTLGVAAPADVTLALLEGSPGADISWHLAQIPTDVGIGDPAAAGLLDTAGVARDLLEELPGTTRALADALLARKRPRLVPAYDRVVRCALGSPADLESRLLDLFADGRLDPALLAARDGAGVPPHVAALRVLDVVLWVRHRPEHLEHGCRGVGW